MRKILLLALLWCSPVWAQQASFSPTYSIPLFGDGATIAQNTTTFLVLGATAAVANPAPTATTGNVSAAPVKGTLRNLRVMQVTAPAAGQTVTYTIQTASAIGSALSSPTGTLTCQITDSSSPVACADSAHAVSLNAGDTFALQVVTSATSGDTGIINWSAEFTR